MDRSVSGHQGNVARFAEPDKHVVDARSNDKCFSTGLIKYPARNAHKHR
jgi:hypothetical protein